MRRDIAPTPLHGDATPHSVRNSLQTVRNDRRTRPIPTRSSRTRQGGPGAVESLERSEAPRLSLLRFLYSRGGRQERHDGSMSTCSPSDTLFFTMSFPRPLYCDHVVELLCSLCDHRVPRTQGRIMRTPGRMTISTYTDPLVNTVDTGPICASWLSMRMRCHKVRNGGPALSSHHHTRIFPRPASVHSIFECRPNIS